MSITLDSPNYASDWLKGESGSGEYFSRDTVVIAMGQGVLPTGTILAQRTADSKYVIAATGTTDGSQTAAAILFTRSVDTTLADQPAVIVSRQATVMHQALVYGPTLNTAALRAVAAQQLAAHGIIDRQGA